MPYEGNEYRIRNQLFPYMLDELRTWVVNNIDIKTQIWSKHEERFLALWLKEKHISELGSRVLKSAKKIYQFFYANFNEISWPTYKIYNWDAGWWQIRMALSDVGMASELFAELDVLHKDLGKVLLKDIYRYQFIEPDMQEVNQ